MFDTGRAFVKNSDDIARIREAGGIIRDIFDQLEKADLVGLSTESLDFEIEKMILRAKARPSFMTISGYRHASCISINHEAVHGVPSRKKKIQAEDLVKIDIGVVKNGYFADSCRSFYRGTSPEKTALLDAGRAALDAGIASLAAGSRAESMAAAICASAGASGCYVHPEFTGHGVGFALHEAPMLLHNFQGDTGIVFEKGMVIALEPVVAQRRSQMVLADDGWCFYSTEGVLSVQFEHTLAITAEGAQILT